jgi:RHS repeat-associated protein
VRGSEPEPFLGRGYTGHEHLPMFGLINMNARLYDPLPGRFLSPDPFVQLPDFTQSYNRYSYALNNPLIYTDQNGEFIFGAIFGFWKGVFTGKNPFKTAWQGGVNEVKITLGLFKGDFEQIVSRFTWELPQTIVGYGFTQFSNYAGQVDKVDYWGGATVSSGNNWGQGDDSAITMGSYITGGRNLEADPNNSLFQHEYGHYLQSQSWGPAYLSRAAIPSLFDTFGKPGDHKFHPIEQDANMRAFKYFNKNVAGFYEATEGGKYFGKGWNFDINSLDIYGNGYDRYVDYKDDSQMALVNALKVTPSVLDYISGSMFFTNPLPILIYGFRNHVHYNKHKYTIY